MKPRKTKLVGMVADAYHGRDAARTRRAMAQLEMRGYAGKLAAALFRVQKASYRAKKYRGKSKSRGYSRKVECIDQLCDILSFPESNVRWGWGKDRKGFLADVLYVDLPCGQVSFHSTHRGHGPDYPGKWDCRQNSWKNVLKFGQEVIDNIDPIEEEKKPRVLAKKKTFTCEECGDSKLSSGARPRGWIEIQHGDDAFLVCSGRCESPMLRKIEDELFGDEEYRLPSGKHTGHLLREVDDRYLRWVSENVESKRSMLRLAANYELRRRQCPSAYGIRDMGQTAHAT